MFSDVWHQVIVHGVDDGWVFYASLAAGICHNECTYERNKRY